MNLESHGRSNRLNYGKYEFFVRSYADDRNLDVFHSHRHSHQNIEFLDSPLLKANCFINTDSEKDKPYSSSLSRIRNEYFTHKDWFDELDLIDIESCSRCEFNSLFISAPTQFTQGMLYGKLTLRIQNSFIPGLEFLDFTEATPDIKALIHSISAKLVALSDAFQEWFDSLDLLDPDFCSRSELEEMILTAPIAFLEGIMFGKLFTRIQMAARTGKVFS